MPELGRAALAATLGLALYALIAGAWAAHTRRRRLALSAQNALIAAFATTVVASLVLLAALVRHDFSFVYVAQHTSRELPTAYTDLGVLGRSGGVAAALAARPDGLLRRRRPAEPPAGARSRRLGRAGARARSPSSSRSCSSRSRRPFALQTAPADGAGLNPSLQNPYMVAHPPLLYLGYVGLDGAVRVRDGRAARAPRGRALDRLDAPLDARGVDGARRSGSCWARSGRTRRSAGAATTPGIPSRTRR